MFVDARGPELEFVRAYNAQRASTDGPLGYGWTSNYHTRLSEAGGGDVTWYDPTDGVFVFTKSGSDYSAPAGISSKLVKLSNLFQLKHKDGSIWFFDSNKNLANITDRNGNHAALAWSNDNPPRLLNVTDDSGLNLTFNYNGAGRISNVTFAPNRNVTFAYEDSGDLKSAANDLGDLINYTYHGDHKLHNWTDPVGRRLQFAYDGTARVSTVNASAVDLSNGNDLYKFTMYSFAYDATWTNVTNARSYVTHINHSAAGNPLLISGPHCGECGAFMLVGKTNGGRGDGFGETSTTVTMTWDGNHDLLSFSDVNMNSWQQSWDARRNPLNLTDPLSNVKRWNWTNIDDGTTYISLANNSTDYRGDNWEYTYDSHGNLNATTDPYGNYSERHYDNYGFETSFRDFRGNITNSTYDTHGYKINTTDATSNVTSYGRDIVGRMLNVTTALGHVWTYSYDALDRLVNETDPALNSTVYSYDARSDRVSVRDALGRYTNTSWNITNGKVANVTDALGHTTTYDYDLVGNLVASTDRLGHQNSYTYDEWNRMIRVTDPGGNATNSAYDAVGTLHNRTDRRGYTWNYTYDAKHRLVNATDPLGNGTLYSYDADNHRVNVTNARGYRWDYSYNALDRLIRTTDPYGNSTNETYDENGNTVNVTDYNGFPTTYNYDALDRRANITNALGYQTNWSYNNDSRLNASRDQGGNFTNASFDLLDRPTQSIDALGNTTNVTYDAIGKIANLTDADGQVTNRTYDALNHLVQERSPLGYTTNYTYDAEGHLISRQDAKGVFTNYTYDENNRLIQVDYPNHVQIFFRYDAEGNRYNATGYMFWRNDTFDGLERPVSITFNYTAFQKTVNYTYDAVGNRLTMKYPDGKLLNYTYDALNRPISETFDTTSTWSFDYDAGSRLVRITYPSGMTIEFNFNAANWITSYYTNTSFHAPIDSAVYTYDKMGNRLGFTDNRNQQTAYTYDKTYRVLTEQDDTNNPETKTTYNYDGVGNRLSEKTGQQAKVDYSYDADNRMTTRGTTSYSYDDDGNLIQQSATPPWTQYEWDEENRLTKETLPNTTFVSYEYTTDGQRISWRQGMAPKTWYGYDFKGTGGFDDLIAEYDLGGIMMVRYVPGPGIDQPLARILVGSGTTYHYTFDALGSVTRLMTTNQIENAKYRYKAFGAARETTEGAVNPYRFTGRELDTVGGDYEFRARYFDTVPGRFLSSDRAGLADGPNKYAYVRDSPLNHIDPSGTRRMDDYAAGTGGSGSGTTQPPRPPSPPPPKPDSHWALDVYLRAKDHDFGWLGPLPGFCVSDCGHAAENLVIGLGFTWENTKRRDLIEHCTWGCYMRQNCMTLFGVLVWSIAASKEALDDFRGISKPDPADIDATVFGSDHCTSSHAYVQFGGGVFGGTPSTYMSYQGWVNENCIQCCIRNYYQPA